MASEVSADKRNNEDKTKSSIETPTDDTEEGNDKVLDRASLIRRYANDLAMIVVEGATDADKLAYFRACKGDTSVAQDRLMNTMEWRGKHKIPSLLTDQAWLVKERDMRLTLWYDYMGPDRHGRPVLIERVGRWKVGNILNSIREDPPAELLKANYETETNILQNDSNSKMHSFLTLHVMSCEILMQMDRTATIPKPNLKDDRGQIIIMDLNGLRPWHLDPRLATAFGRLAKIDSLHYPDTLCQVWVVNAPYLFQALATLVQPFLHSDTFGKFHVSGTVPEELIQCVGKDCLPEELGGIRKEIFPYNEGAPVSDHPKQFNQPNQFFKISKDEQVPVTLITKEFTERELGG
jgi:hypothetical protein